ncbi:hypothetical protein N7457_001234 [Penicillium paradoxum]|uniref:uncharacterized protein n=1 Tax=Penicillium paradoxum TaxID=176176 RepID=UPI0025478F56|nr:uncharacterized protein N7457_001234 [Penicillium paradoxum]KAJ5794635.1 hypothetical protein N7457_001234 [Penicillium paradoxum]
MEKVKTHFSIKNRTEKKHLVVVVEQKLCTFDKSNPKRHLEVTLLMSHEKLHLRPGTTKAPVPEKAAESIIRNLTVVFVEARRLLVAWGIRPPFDDPSAGGILN